MASTYSANTGIELLGDGEQATLWGQTVNSNMEIVDRALNGSANISISGTTHTLTTSNSILSDGQYAVINFTGSPSGTNTVTIAPNTAQKVYMMVNSTAQTIVVAQGSGSTASIPAGRSKLLYSDGAGVGAGVFDVAAILKANTVSVADGGTGATDAATARTNLGLSTMAMQAAGAVSITGGTITGITDLAVADGGTGASTAAAARANLGAASSATTITAENGLTGSGTLGSNLILTLTGRALALHNMTTTGIVVQYTSGVYTARAIAAGAGITVSDGNGSAGDPTVAVDSTVARTTTEIQAGDGLTGGGTIAATRVLDLGTPSSITDTSTNSVTANSHTHALSEQSVRQLIAQGDENQVGTYAFLRRENLNQGIVAGVNYAGSDLRYAGVVTTQNNWNAEVEGPNNTAVGGTWKAMGSVTASSGCYSMTLFLRVA